VNRPSAARAPNTGCCRGSRLGDQHSPGAVTSRPLWVLGLVIGGGLLAVILTAEYIAIDADDLRQPFAEAVLTAVSFAAYLLLAIALRAAETRLYLILPALAFTASVVSLRTWHLRLGGEWAWIEARPGAGDRRAGSRGASITGLCRRFPTGWRCSVRLMP